MYCSCSRYNEWHLFFLFHRLPSNGGPPSLFSHPSNSFPSGALLHHFRTECTPKARKSNNVAEYARRIGQTEILDNGQIKTMEQAWHEHYMRCHIDTFHVTSRFILALTTNQKRNVLVSFIYLDCSGLLAWLARKKLAAIKSEQILFASYSCTTYIFIVYYATTM